jgi:RNA polymerase sigma-70 factor (ECF subfamily)
MESATKLRPERVVAVDAPTDTDVVARIRAGDERAFEAMFRAHADTLCRLAYYYLESRALAEEVVQDVLLRMWERRAALVVRDSLRAYLHAAVRNRALDAMKAARSAARTEGADRAPDDMQPPGMGQVSRSPLEDLEARELSVALRTATDGLPERCRQVFRLRWELHLSYSEIAELLHISVKAVERHRQRGLERLAKSLREFMP